jgi:alanyl-tRNA synthetase
VDIAHPQLKPEEATQVEDLANSIIYENRPILTYQVTPDQVGHIPLRKPPAVQGMIRIVEVQGFDYSACGGTHVRQTGEIGLIKIRKWERRGTVTRVDFYCGRRALLDYRWKNAAITTLAGSLNLKDRDVVEGIQRALAAGREAMKALEEAREKLLDVEARHLLASAAEGRSGRLVVCLFEGRPVDELRRLALRLTAHPGVHALLGSRSGNQAALVFARSPDLTGDMSTLLQAVIHQIGGRGGGSPTLAQGGGPRSAGLQAALDEAVARLSTWSP